MSSNNSEGYDVVIIGGGIAGAGAVQASAAAGYKVLLLEKEAYGSQTSAHSSKLIHGGLRYLEGAQFGLVRESLMQRRALLRLAPKLVKPIPFYIPVYKNSRRGVLILRAGLTLYTMLAGFEKLSRFNQLPKSNWPELKGLKQENLKAVFKYWDAQTDDQQLTEAVIRCAQSLGASTLCPASFVSAIKIENGYQISYDLDGETQSCYSKCIINATGPWVNLVANTITPKFIAPRIDWIKGSHIILKQPSPKHVYYLESKLDQRVILVMPWYGKTMIGTTEIAVTDINAEATVTEQEIDYLLTTYKEYFPESDVEIESQFSGIRVLPANKKTSFKRSRESKLWSPEDHPNLRIIYGGKLTTFRSRSIEIVDWIQNRIGKRKPLADIDELEIF